MNAQDQRKLLVNRMYAAQAVPDRVEANKVAYELAAFDAAQRNAARRNAYYR